MCTRLVLSGLILMAMSSGAAAHFPWLATDDAGHAILFFGESPAERNYHLPEAVEKAEVAHVDANQQATAVDMPVVEEEEFIGRRSTAAVEGTGPLRAKVAYGVYHGALLTYYVQHERAIVAEGQSSASQADPAFRATLSSAADGGVAVQVLWKGQPLADAEVKLFSEEGHEEAAAETNKEGRVSFDGGSVEPGLNGLIIGHEEPRATGEIDGKEYTSAINYLTVTFHKSAVNGVGAEKPKAKAAAGAKADTNASLPPLPAPIASFGAAVSEGWLYVYSGHTGTAHAHSKDNLSAHFSRLKLAGGTAWETLPMPQPLQGLPLVAHGGMLYRVGGLDARNAAGEEDDLHSVDVFARFDPATNKWESLPSLPEPRSSHDAVVIDGKLYVVGGWKLTGSDDGEWLTTAWVYDLDKADATWQAIPSPPFQRRALALASLEGRLIVLGGMDSENSVTGRVDAFDPATGKWSQLASFPADGFEAFGISAWNLDGALYACGMDGALQRLNSVEGQWEEAGEVSAPRFFHRLLPADAQRLVVVAGASPDEGHLATLEVLQPRVQ